MTLDATPAFGLIAGTYLGYSEPFKNGSQMLISREQALNGRVLARCVVASAFGVLVRPSWLNGGVVASPRQLRREREAVDLPT